MATKSFNQSLAANGGSNGTLTVADSSGFEIGAIVFLAAKNQRVEQLKVSSKPSSTSVVVVTPADTTFDASQYTVASSAKLFQPRSEIFIVNSPSATPISSTTILRTTSIAVPNDPELVLNGDTGDILIIKQNGTEKLTVDVDGTVEAEGYLKAKLGVLSNGGADTLNMYGQTVDGATAVGINIGTNNPMTHADAKLLRIINGVVTGSPVEKAYFDKDGKLWTPGILFADGTTQTTAGGGGGGGGGGVSDLQGAFDAQADTVVTLTDTATLDLSSGKSWIFRDKDEANLMRVVEGSVAGTSTVEISQDVDLLDVYATNVEFKNGIQVASSSLATVISIGGTTDTIHGFGNLKLVSNGVMTFSDMNMSSMGSTWSLSDGVSLSSDATEWESFKTEFGEVSLLNAITQAKTSGGGGGGGASSLQDAYDGGDTITLTDGNNFEINAPATGSAGLLLDAKGVRSNLTVTDERLDIKSEGGRSGGLQVLVESTNTAGTSQVFVRAGTSTVLQAGNDPYPFYVLADAANKAVSIEANDDTGSIFIGGAASNSAISIGSSGQRYITIGNGSGATTVDVNPGIGGFLVDTASTGPISLDANGGASNFTVTGANLTLSTATSGNLILQSANAISIGTDASNGSIQIGTSGTRTISLGSRTAPVIMGSAVPSSQNGAPVGYRLKSAGTSQFAITEVIRFDSSGNLAKADADGAGIAREVVGIALENDSSSEARVATMYGSVVEVKFASAPSVGDEGKPVYLSTTAGAATLTQPSELGQRVYKLGVLSSSTIGPNNGYFIVYQPQFIQDITSAPVT